MVFILSVFRLIINTNLAASQNKEFVYLYKAVYNHIKIFWIKKMTFIIFYY